MRDQQSDRARELLDSVRKDPNVKKLLDPEQLRAINNLRSAVDNHEDKYLYELVRDPGKRTARNIKNYLENAPLKTMKQEVERYDAYLKQMQGQLEVKLIADFNWGKDAWQKETEAKIRVNGTAIILEKLQAIPNQSSTIQCDPLKSKLDQEIMVTVRARALGFFLYSNPDQGKGEGKFKLSDLQGAGKRIDCYLSHYAYLFIGRMVRQPMMVSSNYPLRPFLR